MSKRVGLSTNDRLRPDPTDPMTRDAQKEPHDAPHDVKLYKYYRSPRVRTRREFGHPPHISRKICLASLKIFTSIVVYVGTRCIRPVFFSFARLGLLRPIYPEIYNF